VTRGSGLWFDPAVGYGLFTFTTSSIIHLLFPLTKESVSTNNNGGQNYGGNGTIETVAVFNTNSSTAN